MNWFDWYTESKTVRVEQPGAPVVIVRSGKFSDDSIRSKLGGDDTLVRAAILSTCCFSESGEPLPYEAALTFDIAKSTPLLDAFERINSLSDDDVQAAEKN